MPRFKKTRITLFIVATTLSLFAISLFFVSTIIFPLFGGDKILVPEDGSYIFLYGINFFPKLLSDLPFILSFRSNLFVAFLFYFQIIILALNVTFTILKKRYVMFVHVIPLILSSISEMIIFDFLCNQFLSYNGQLYNYLTLILFNNSMDIIVQLYFWVVFVFTCLALLISLFLTLTIVFSNKKLPNEKDDLEKETFEKAYPTVREVREISKEEIIKYIKENKEEVLKILGLDKLNEPKEDLESDSELQELLKRSRENKEELPNEEKEIIEEKNEIPTSEEEVVEEKEETILESEESTTKPDNQDLTFL